MDFTMWEPIYRQVLDNFGFGRIGDKRARDALADLVRPFDHDRLNWAGVTIIVCRAVPMLNAELDRLDDPDVGMVVAASTAADTVRDAGFDPDLTVTDLNKSPETTVELTELGVSVAIHAHGDNPPAIREWVPQFDADHVLETAQAAPVGPAVSWGGFVDGDRAASIADELGAKRLVFAGRGFDSPAVDTMKVRKPRRAERLLRWLGRRRNGRSPVLDGQRDGVDPFP